MTDRPRRRAGRERREIARRLELSVETVHRFYSEKQSPLVAPRTRSAIMRAAAEINYQPGPRASRTPWRERQVVGYQPPRPWDPEENSVFARTFAVLLHVVESRGMTLRTFDLRATGQGGHEAQRREAELGVVERLQELYSRAHIQGFVFNDAVPNDPRLAEAEETDIPFVLLGDPGDIPRGGPVRRPGPRDRRLAPARPDYARNWPCVDINDGRGFAEMAILLIGARKCRRLLRIAFAPDGTFVGPRRGHGVALGLAVAREDLGLAVADPVEVTLPYGVAAADAVREIETVLAAHPDIDGVIADCDHFAAYAIRAADGFRPRRSIDVAACDDNALRRAADAPWLSLATPYMQVAAALIDTLQAAMRRELTDEQRTRTTRLLPQIAGLTPDDRAWAASTGLAFPVVTGSEDLP